MIYNAYLAFKYRPRLTVWGKMVVAWVVISLPWIAALAYYTITGADPPERLVPLTVISGFASAVFAFAGPMGYYIEYDEPDKWRLWRRVDG